MYGGAIPAPCRSACRSSTIRTAGTGPEGLRPSLKPLPAREYTQKRAVFSTFVWTRENAELPHSPRALSSQPAPLSITTVGAPRPLQNIASRYPPTSTMLVKHFHLGKRLRLPSCPFNPY